MPKKSTKIENIGNLPERKRAMAAIALASKSYEGLLQWCVTSLQKGVIDGEENKEGAKFLIHLLLATEEDQNTEVLGHVWREVGESSKLGQVQTPIEIADYITKLTVMQFANKKEHSRMTPEYIIKNGMQVLDPCSGQAIFHISVKKQFFLAHKMDFFYRTWFYAVDIDLRCALMSVLNMAVRNFKGIVFHGDALCPPGVVRDYEVRAWGLYPTRSGISNVHEFSKEEALKIFMLKIHKDVESEPKKKEEKGQLKMF